MRTVLQQLYLWCRWPFAAVGRFVLAIGRGLLAVWRFIGRLGLAMRNLLFWLFRPITWPLEKLLWPFVRPMWRYAIHMSRALGRMIGWLIWPFIWPFYALLVVLGKLVRLAWRTAVSAIRARWQATAPARARLRRRWLSRAEVAWARARVWAVRPRPPAQAVLAPIVVREVVAGNGGSRGRAPRLLTAFVTVNVLVVAFGFIAVQMNPEWGSDLDATLIASSGDPTRTPSPTPTLTPSPTQTPTPTFTPTPAIIALTPWPTPDPLQGGGSLLFTLRQNGNSDLYVLSLGQDAPVRLTNHPADDTDGVWSPDGRRLAFASQRDGNWELYTLDMTTGRTTRVTNHMGYDGQPGWSPDGQWLVFESYREENLDIYIVKADGREEPYRLTQDPSADFAPVWGPDGRHIAFSSWRGGQQDLYVMSLDEVGDERAVNITNSAERQENGAAFHPNGEAIAYYDTSTGYSLVYVQRLENYRPVGQPISVGQGRQPTWSPNGQSLAYVHELNGRHYLIASSVDAWAVAPQTFAPEVGRLAAPSWSAITLVQEPVGFVQAIAETADPPLYTETLSRTVDGPAPYRLIQVGVDAPYPFLSDTVEQSFLALRERLIEEVGWDVLAELDKLYEPLAVGAGPGQSDRTWHKAGRAFGLAEDLALGFNPQIEIVPEVVGQEMFWRIYVRVAVQDGSQGEPLRARPWDFRARFGADPRHYDQGGVLRESIPAGYYVDLTALAADYGWERVPAEGNWRTFFPGIRYGVFENRGGLAWEAAMGEVYGAAELAGVLGE
ncbi:MAG: PD40 domain-containing protein [Chloroflexi bacterium]|nr:PD40 domain-containing protein [Chloroflexota bacterium]